MWGLYRQTFMVKYKNCKCCLEYVEVKEKILELKFFKFNKDHEKNLIKT